jgi:hypothetical protein
VRFLAREDWTAVSVVRVVRTFRLSTTVARCNFLDVAFGVEEIQERLFFERRIRLAIAPGRRVVG